MNIVDTYSHLGGREILLQNKPGVWQEINDVVTSVNANLLKTKASNESRKGLGTLLYNPKAMNARIAEEFKARGWAGGGKTEYYICADVALLREHPEYFEMTASEQRSFLERHGKTKDVDYFRSHNETDFMKDRVAVEVQFGKYAFFAYDFFQKHLAFFQQNRIDVGVEIVPAKTLQRGMSTGVGFYESAVYQLSRLGRNSPALPLVVIAVAP